MQIRSGTSGFSYKTWKGRFYPEDLSDRAMLGYYAQQLPAVEINNTFYRLPKADVLRSWAGQVPESFRFSIKASRRITHMKRLKDVSEPLQVLIQNLEHLGANLGAVLFQLPPNLSRDLSRLQQFLALLPDGWPAAFEFRHPSWCDDEVLAALAARKCTWCVAEADDATESDPSVALVGAFDWGYLRLRRTHYDDAELTRWRDAMLSRDWRFAYVFFKHEDEATGPGLARRFQELVDAVC